MKLQTNLYHEGQWDKPLDASLDSAQTLVTVFSTYEHECHREGLQELFATFPQAVIIGCSTSGEIYEDQFHDGALSVGIMQFSSTQLVRHTVNVETIEASCEAGRTLVNGFDQQGLRSLFVLADGMRVDGSSLVEGLNQALNPEVIVTGGMASDNGRFTGTWLLVDNQPEFGVVCAVGFYGEHFRTSYASKGGFSRFGMERLVTSCDEQTHTIHTLDNKPALELYKVYMGEHAKKLPNSALQFPWLVIDSDGDSKIRAIQDANEEEQSVQLFGGVKTGDRVVFMKGSFNYVVAGAQQAVQRLEWPTDTPVMSLTVSCMGRRSVLQDRTDEEVEVVKETLGEGVAQVGFYSYGELSPRTSGKCGLLNQTMTLTLFWES